MTRTGRDPAGLVHAVDDDDRPLCDDEGDELQPGTDPWPPTSGIACPACQQVAGALGL